MRNAIIAILTLTLSSIPAAAQPASDSWDNLAKIQAGQRIEVVDTKFRKFNGKFVSVTREEFSLRVKNEVVTFQKSEVARVGLRRSRSRRAFIGMLIGLGIGGGLTPMGWAAGEENGSAALALLPVGLGLGAGIGAALPPSYQKVYQVEMLPAENARDREQK
jgi:hypothetical protein